MSIRISEEPKIINRINNNNTLKIIHLEILQINNLIKNFKTTKENLMKN